MTGQQNMQALALANDIHRKGCALRRRIKALSYAEGCEIVADLLVDDNLPPHIDAMRTERLIEAIDSVGVRRLQHIRHEAQFHRRDIRIRDLTIHEKQRLAEVLRRRAGLVTWESTQP